MTALSLFRADLADSLFGLKFDKFNSSPPFFTSVSPSPGVSLDAKFPLSSGNLSFIFDALHLSLSNLSRSFGEFKASFSLNLAFSPPIFILPLAFASSKSTSMSAKFALECALDTACSSFAAAFSEIFGAKRLGFWLKFFFCEDASEFYLSPKYRSSPATSALSLFFASVLKSAK